MSAPTISIVIVSRARPEALMQCLTGVAQLDYPAFEVVVVACPDGMAAVAARGDAHQIKQVTFDEANIAKARNLGIAQAAGEIVAFIDDDAVPEPAWLHHLAGAFAETEVAAAGGYVIGRNGISMQWRARGVDPRGVTHDITMDGDQPVVLHPQADRAIKTEGTNMAVRREVLAELGGFDPAYHFYLDETDLNLRLARAGLATAIVPLAQVHHGFAESPRRARDRTPRDLREIGASVAAFLARHCPDRDRKAAWKHHRNEQRLRCLRALQRGGIGADDVMRLMRGLKKGYRDGLARIATPLPALPRSAEAFRPYPGRPGAPRRIIAGRSWQAAARRGAATAAVRDGAICSLYLLSPTTLFHRVRFAPEGYWEQRGGVFGRSLRSDPVFRLTTFPRRLKRESQRVAPVRDVTNGRQ